MIADSVMEQPHEILCVKRSSDDPPFQNDLTRERPLEIDTIRALLEEKLGQGPLVSTNDYVHVPEEAAQRHCTGFYAELEAPTGFIDIMIDKAIALFTLHGRVRSLSVERVWDERMRAYAFSLAAHSG